KKFEQHLKETPAVNEARINNFEIGGPDKQTMGPSAESLKKIFICGHEPGHHTPECLRRIVTDLTRRAYRRPVTPQDVNRIMTIALMAKHDNESFEEQVCQALEAILVSPDFLFRVEKNRVAAASGDYLISQHELASRLSYFLWSSMPDDKL